MQPVGWTFCSGIGAPEMAAPWVDWRMASEIEPFPRAVLADRFGYRAPEDHNQGDPLLWGDFTQIGPDMARARGVPLPDVIVAGTPCQAFSIAGLRKGVADDRGNLTLKFVEVLHNVVAARPDGKLAVLWENVPGVLSDSENAFGCFLGGIVGAMDPLPSPDGGSWPGEGMVEGPRSRAAWAVLDAQFFGVAQRRRRVFVVVDFGNVLDPAAVLLEPDRLRGDSPPRRKAGQGIAADVASSLVAGGCGVEPVDSTVSARDYKGAADLILEGVAHALRGEGFDASEDGTGRGTPLVPMCFPAEMSATQMATSVDLSPALSVTHTNAVAFDMRGRDGGAQMEGPHDTANLRAASGGSSRSYVADQWAVRRLMPVECARLQGFPDDHTAIEYKGKPAADGPQYKAYGNSMAVPVVRWIMDRMRISAGWS